MIENAFWVGFALAMAAALGAIAGHGPMWLSNAGVVTALGFGIPASFLGIRRKWSGGR